MKSFLLFMLTALSAHARMCDISPFSELEKITLSLHEQQKECIRSLAYNPASPTGTKERFQQLAGKEVLSISCNYGEDHDEDENEFMRYLFITEEGLKAVTYPVYRWEGRDGDLYSLPQGVVRLKVGTEDHLLYLDFVDQPTVYPYSQLPEVARKLSASAPSVLRDNIVKYDRWLATKNKTSALQLKSVNDEESSYFANCLQAFFKVSQYNYISTKFQGKIPSFNSMADDHNLYEALKPEKQKLYEEPWSEFKARILKDFRDNHPTCEGIIPEAQTTEQFETIWGERMSVYEKIHNRFYKK